MASSYLTKVLKQAVASLKQVVIVFTVAETEVLNFDALIFSAVGDY